DMPPLPRLSNAAFERIAGLTSFADWIGSSLDHAPLHDDLRDYFVAALARASERLDGIGWIPRVPLLTEPAPLEEVFAYLGQPGKPFRPHRLQRRTKTLVDGATGPALLLIEAPMGGGK